jgi:hypothetical protein
MYQIRITISTRNVLKRVEASTAAALAQPTTEYGDWRFGASMKETFGAFSSDLLSLGDMSPGYTIRINKDPNQ